MMAIITRGATIPEVPHREPYEYEPETTPGDLGVGSYTPTYYRDKPVRRRKKRRFPFGFCLPGSKC